jgi:hypothetical protein
MDPTTQSNAIDDLAKIFNTVLVAHHAQQAASERDFLSELQNTVDTAEFKAILGTIRQFAKLQCITEKEASQRILQTFFKLNNIWSAYLTREGIESLKSSK